MELITIEDFGERELSVDQNTSVDWSGCREALKKKQIV